MNEPGVPYVMPRLTTAAVTCFDTDSAGFPSTHDKGFHLVLESNSRGVVTTKSFDWVRAAARGRFNEDVTMRMQTVEYGMNPTENPIDWEAADEILAFFWKPEHDCVYEPEEFEGFGHYPKCFVQDFTRGDYIPWDLSKYGKEFGNPYKLNLTDFILEEKTPIITCAEMLGMMGSKASGISIIAALVTLAFAF